MQTVRMLAHRGTYTLKQNLYIYIYTHMALAVISEAGFDEISEIATRVRIIFEVLAVRSS
jgi:hypothetical protein